MRGALAHMDPAAGKPCDLLDPRGARVVLGAAPAGLVAPLAPAAHSLFGPRGACLVGVNGPLAVCDTGHHRILLWRRLPDRDNSPADLVIGQPDLASEGRNGNREVGAATVNMPTGIAAAGDVLAVADAWNHRVLLWRRPLTRSNQPADIVLGQPDFVSAAANRGLSAPRADTLNWCFGVAIRDGRLFVADTGNRRLLVWDGIPETSGAPADLVLGQPDFTTRDENAGGADGSVGMGWPHGVTTAADRLLVIDAGKHRVMVWERLPGRAGAPCDLVLGQPDRARTDANRRADAPSAASLSQPYGIAPLGDRIVVADTANSRLLGFAAAHLRMGGDADALAGQPAYDRKGENGWGAARRDTLSWPYGIATCGARLVVADTGNNRVLLWGAP
jgi:hypothetical protein